jgi:predicted transcriptional regulator
MNVLFVKIKLMDFLFLIYIEKLSGLEMDITNNNNNNNNIRSPELKASIIEPILLHCINGVSICELSCEIQRLLPLPYNTLKKYLFYLVSYELISYNGQRQVYVTEDGGLDLLHKINREKRDTMVNNEDIIITIE